MRGVGGARARNSALEVPAFLSPTPPPRPTIRCVLRDFLAVAMQLDDLAVAHAGNQCIAVGQAECGDRVIDLGRPHFLAVGVELDHFAIAPYWDQHSAAGESVRHAEVLRLARADRLAFLALGVDADE